METQDMQYFVTDAPVGGLHVNQWRAWGNYTCRSLSDGTITVDGGEVVLSLSEDHQPRTIFVRPRAIAWSSKCMLGMGPDNAYLR